MSDAPLELPAHLAAPAVQPEVFSVEQILGRRERKGRVEYLIKWMGYGKAFNSWEPSQNIFDHRFVEDYERAREEAVRATGGVGRGKGSRGFVWPPLDSPASLLDPHAPAGGAPPPLSRQPRPSGKRPLHASASTSADGRGEGDADQSFQAAALSEPPAPPKRWRLGDVAVQDGVHTPRIMPTGPLTKRQQTLEERGCRGAAVAAEAAVLGAVHKQPKHCSPTQLAPDTPALAGGACVPMSQHEPHVHVGTAAEPAGAASPQEACYVDLRDAAEIAEEIGSPLSPTPSSFPQLGQQQHDQQSLPPLLPQCRVPPPLPQQRVLPPPPPPSAPPAQAGPLAAFSARFPCGAPKRPSSAQCPAWMHCASAKCSNAKMPFSTCMSRKVGATAIGWHVHVRDRDGGPTRSAIVTSWDPTTGTHDLLYLGACQDGSTVDAGVCLGNARTQIDEDAHAIVTQTGGGEPHGEALLELAAAAIVSAKARPSYRFRCTCGVTFDQCSGFWSSASELVAALGREVLTQCAVCAAYVHSACTTGGVDLAAFGARTAGALCLDCTDVAVEAGCRRRTSGEAPALGPPADLDGAAQALDAVLALVDAVCAASAADSGTLGGDPLGAGNSNGAYADGQAWPQGAAGGASRGSAKQPVFTCGLCWSCASAREGPRDAKLCACIWRPDGDYTCYAVVIVSNGALTTHSEIRIAALRMGTLAAAEASADLPRLTGIVQACSAGDLAGGGLRAGARNTSDGAPRARLVSRRPVHARVHFDNGAIVWLSERQLLHCARAPRAELAYSSPSARQLSLAPSYAVVGTAPIPGHRDMGAFAYDRLAVMPLGNARAGQCALFVTAPQGGSGGGPCPRPAPAASWQPAGVGDAHFGASSSAAGAAGGSSSVEQQQQPVAIRRGELVGVCGGVVRRRVELASDSETFGADIFDINSTICVDMSSGGNLTRFMRRTVHKKAATVFAELSEIHRELVLTFRAIHDMRPNDEVVCKCAYATIKDAGFSARPFWSNLCSDCAPCEQPAHRPSDVDSAQIKLRADKLQAALDALPPMPPAVFGRRPLNRPLARAVARKPASAPEGGGNHTGWRKDPTAARAGNGRERSFSPTEADELRRLMVSSGAMDEELLRMDRITEPRAPLVPPLRAPPEAARAQAAAGGGFRITQGTQTAGPAGERFDPLWVSGSLATLADWGVKALPSDWMATLRRAARACAKVPAGVVAGALAAQPSEASSLPDFMRILSQAHSNSAMLSQMLAPSDQLLLARVCKRVHKMGACISSLVLGTPSSGAVCSCETHAVGDVSPFRTNCSSLPYVTTKSACHILRAAQIVWAELPEGSRAAIGDERLLLGAMCMELVAMRLPHYRPAWVVISNLTVDMLGKLVADATDAVFLRHSSRAQSAEWMSQAMFSLVPLRTAVQLLHQMIHAEVHHVHLGSVLPASIAQACAHAMVPGLAPRAHESGRLGAHAHHQSVPGPSKNLAFGASFTRACRLFAQQICSVLGLAHKEAWIRGIAAVAAVKSGRADTAEQAKARYGSRLSDHLFCRLAAAITVNQQANELAIRMGQHDASLEPPEPSDDGRAPNAQLGEGKRPCAAAAPASVSLCAATRRAPPPSVVRAAAVAAAAASSAAAAVTAATRGSVPCAQEAAPSASDALGSSPSPAVQGGQRS